MNFAARIGDLIWGVGSTPNGAVFMARKNIGCDCHGGTAIVWTISAIDDSMMREAMANGGVLWRHALRDLPIEGMRR